MPNVIPAPIPPATATASGVVSTGAQVLGAGVKTFSSGIIANSAATFNAALTVAKLPVVNEPAVYLPTPVSSGGYGLAGAVLWSTTNSYLHHSTTALSLNAYAVPLKLTAAFSTVEVVGGNGTGASDVGVKVGVSTADASVNTGATLWAAYTGIGGTEVQKLRVAKDGGLWNVNGRLGSFSSANVYVWCDSGAARLVYASTVLEVVSGTMQLFDGSAYSFKVVSGGRLDQSGTDSSGTPGSRTGANAINKPTGKSAIASGQATCQIDNSLVAAGDQVHITWHGDLGTQSKIPWVTTAAGSFTVNVGTAPASNVAFCWTVQKRL